MKTRSTVFVGMSGGVDSSVSAYLLKQQGYEVVGVFIKVWHPDFLPCHWERERLDAMRVAAHLEIPFLTCDAEAVYKKDVADYFIAEYAAGRTPNPDVMCNTHVKFGAFYDFARAHGADYIATGHYAQTLTHNERVTLVRGVDPQKDQSYFLWNVREEVLQHVLFPIGGLTKAAVRRIAHKVQLPTAQKRESQGICFLGHVDIPSFLAHFVTLEEGVVLTDEGVTVGVHDGALLYTIGQRHGFRINPEHTHVDPYYVVQKDMARNILTVSHTKPKVGAVGSLLTLQSAWIHKEPTNSACMVQTRYRQHPTLGEVQSFHDGVLTVALLEAGELPAVGQSCVLYNDNRVMGGGIIAEIPASV